MKRWTDQQMIVCIRKAADELDELDTKQYIAWSKQRNVPSLSSIVQRFGSWREALAHAKVRNSSSHFSDEDILHHLHEAADTLSPFTSHTYREWAKQNGKPSLTLISSRFGSWSKALTAAKLQSSTTRNNEERIVQALLEASEELPRLTSQHYAIWAQERGYPTVATIARKYGSWSYALFVLDISPPRLKWDENDVIRTLGEARRELENFNILHYREWARGRNVPSTSTINGLFGSWSAALQCLDEQESVSAR